MSSIDPSPPPVVRAQVDTSLAHEVKVSGRDFLQDDTVSINDYLAVTKTAYQNSHELLQEVEQQKSQIAAEQGKQLGLEASSYTRLLNALRNSYRSNSVNASGFSQPTQDVNTKGTTLNTETSSSTNIAAVEAYNQAVTDFNAAQAAFDSSPKAQSDIDTYNAAVATFNAAATTYNSAMTSVNTAINDYNLAVDAYNLEVQQANAQIEIQNQTAVPPLIPREELPHATVMATGPTLTTYPPGATTPPTAVSLPLPVATNLIDYSETSFGDILDASGLISAEDAFEHFVDRTSEFQDYTTKDLKEKPQKQQKNINQPDAYIKPEDNTAPASAGTGSSAVAANTSTLGDQKILSVLTKLQVKQLLVNLNIPPDFGVQQTAQALTSTFFTSSVVPAFNPNAPAESLLISAVATLAAGAAQSQSGVTEEAVNAYVQTAEEFKNLNEGEKKQLAQALGALVELAVLTLGAAGLAGQVGGASALAPALSLAQVAANPSSSGQQFQQIQKALDEVKGTFGEENVAATIGKLSTEELTRGGLNSQTAYNIGNAVGSSITQNGFGSSQADLISLVQTAAKDATGEALPEGEAQKLARSLLLLGLGSAFQLNAEGHVVLNIEPEQASQLVEQSTIRLFGFSPNFSQATISRRESEPKEELAFAKELEKQVEKLKETGDKKSVEIVQTQLDNFTKTVDDLGSFLTDQFLDPGNTFQGLMYGSRGSEFRRGSVDINVG